jgi:hypothetical protein
MVDFPMEPAMVSALSLAASLAAFVPNATAGTFEGSASSTRASVAASSQADASVATTVDATAAAHCARAGELIGSNCSYTTGMMARRVMEDGQDWSYVGGLSSSENNLGSMVAAPYTVAGGAYVIANELLEMVTTDGDAAARLSLVGKVLEVDGVRYVVLTSFKVINS